MDHARPPDRQGLGKPNQANNGQISKKNCSIRKQELELAHPLVYSQLLAETSRGLIKEALKRRQPHEAKFWVSVAQVDDLSVHEATWATQGCTATPLWLSTRFWFFSPLLAM